VPQGSQRTPGARLGCRRTHHVLGGSGTGAVPQITARFQSPPVKPCVRFSRTRLTDVLHRRHSAFPGPEGPGRDDDPIEADQTHMVRRQQNLGHPPFPCPAAVAPFGQPQREPGRPADARTGCALEPTRPQPAHTAVSARGHAHNHTTSHHRAARPARSTHLPGAATAHPDHDQHTVKHDRRASKDAQTEAMSITKNGPEPELTLQTSVPISWDRRPYLWVDLTQAGCLACQACGERDPPTFGPLAAEVGVLDHTIRLMTR
jgi:hypothetical protein